MRQFGKVLQDGHRVGACVIHRIEAGQRVGDLPLHQLFEQVEDLHPFGNAQHVADDVFVDFGLRPAMGNRLVEQRQAVAHRPVGGPRNQPDGPARNGRPLGLGDSGEMIDQHVVLHPAQVEPLAARQHGHRHPADFRGRENELHMLRRFFERLEKRIERVARQHVDFVDDVDLVARRNGPVENAVDQLADIVNAGAARGIHLHHVDMAVFGNRDAVLADSAGIGRRLAIAVRAGAVQCAGDDARGRGFPDTANARQDKGMG